MLLLIGAAAIPATAQTSTSFTIPADAEISNNDRSYQIQTDYNSFDISLPYTVTYFDYEGARINADLYPAVNLSTLKDDLTHKLYNSNTSYAELTQMAESEDEYAEYAQDAKTAVDTGYQAIVDLASRMNLDLAKGGAYINRISTAEGKSGMADIVLPNELILNNVNYTLTGLGWENEEHGWGSNNCSLDYRGNITFSSTATYLNIQGGGVLTL